MAGQHQDRCGETTGADALADVNTAEIRKIPIQNDQIRCRGGLGTDQAASTIRGDLDVVTLNIKFELKQVRQPGFVIHHQHAEAG